MTRVFAPPNRDVVLKLGDRTMATNYIPADSSLWRSPAFRKARAPQNVWSVQDNLSYNVSGHNFWSTTNWAIIYYRAILTVVVITRGPGEKIVVFLTVFCSPILKSSKSQPVEGQDQLLFTKPWRISPTFVLFFYKDWKTSQLRVRPIEWLKLKKAAWFLLEYEWCLWTKPTIWLILSFTIFTEGRSRVFYI